MIDAYKTQGTSPPRALGTPSPARDRLVERFLRHVRIEPVHWWWSGAKTSHGYGAIGVKLFDERAWLEARGVRGGSAVLAHRISYALFAGVVPAGHHVAHTCDLPPCVRPDHLWPARPVENVADMIAKDRKARQYGEQNGFAKLTAEVVEEIRRLYAMGGVTQRELGEKFGIRQTHVSKLVNGQRWTHTPRATAEPAAQINRRIA